ncbi:MAG: DNA replication and repair protein RecF, partial [Christensenellales bacterium]
IGPHRDDIKIESNGIDLRSFGSKGQQRTGALSLKLAELEVFKDNIGEYPVLLLDDVLSELDTTRQNKLLEYVANIQTILTCTDFNFNIPHTKFLVEQGNVYKLDK